MAPGDARARAQRTGLSVSLAWLLAAACREPTAPPPSPKPTATAEVAKAAAAKAEPAAPAPAASTPSPPRPLRRCFDDLPNWSESPVPDLLDQAGAAFERRDYEAALACAEEAARQMPRSLEAHHDRALALGKLGRFEDARDAVALLLALAPDDLDSLELAADFYVNQLAPTAERAAIGLEHARRAARLVRPRDRERRARLKLLEGQALIDLGRAQEALRPLAIAQQLAPQDAGVRYERGVALFELCRFPEARRSFEAVTELEPDHAHALYHLGLIAERDGRDDEAARRFAAASERDPVAFPTVPSVSMAEFEARMRRAVGQLPADVLRDLEGVPVEAAELPALEDLVAERPPLSPTILGLYRGLPLGREPAGEDTTPAAARGGQGRAMGSVARPAGAPAAFATPERTIVLYRRNILRSIASEADLDAAISRTLLHEIGHLRGEDDGSLRDRGLE